MRLTIRLINWRLFISFVKDGDYLIIDLIRPWKYWTRDKRIENKLCKFYPLSDTIELTEKNTYIKHNYGLDSLKNYYWYSSVASSFNDIADCNPSLLSIVSIEKEYRKHVRKNNIGEISREKFKNMFVKTQLDLLDKSFGITCFSNESNSKNHLMWAHYADDHKGICIKFHPLKIFPNRIILPVVYTKQKPKISLNEIIHFLPLIKSECWGYENEFRLISFNIQNGNRKISYNPSQVSDIYFGSRFDLNERKQEILSIIKDKYPKANLAQLELDEKTIKLVSKPVSIELKEEQYEIEQIVK